MYTQAARLEQRAREHHEYICGVARQFSCEKSLLFIKRFIFSAKQPRRGIFEVGRQELGEFVWPYLIDTVLRHSTTLYGAPTMDSRTLMHLFDKYMDCPDPLEHVDCANKGQRAVHEHMIRMSFEQLPFQEPIKSLIPRYNRLFCVIPNSHDMYHDFAKARDMVVKRQLRVSIDDALKGGVAFNILGDTHDYIPRVPTTEVSVLKDCMESDASQLLLDHLVIDHQEYKKIASADDTEPYLYRKHSEFLIYRKPLIRFGDAIMAPFPRLIFDRVTRWLFKDFYDYFEENHTIRAFTQHYGDILKDYVGWLLKDRFGEGKVLDVDTLQSSTDTRADWLLVSGKTVFVIEVKSGSYSKALRRTGSLTDLESFADKHIFPALSEQCASTITFLRSSQLLPESLSTATRFRPLVVIEENWYLSNTITEFLPESKTARLIIEEGGAILSLLDIEFLSDHEFNVPFEDVYDQKLASPDTQVQSLSVYLKSLSGVRRLQDSALSNEFRKYFNLRKTWPN